jgi:hypothetical protein
MAKRKRPSRMATADETTGDAEQLDSRALDGAIRAIERLDSRDVDRLCRHIDAEATKALTTPDARHIPTKCALIGQWLQWMFLHTDETMAELRKDSIVGSTAGYFRRRAIEAMGKVPQADVEVYREIKTLQKTMTNQEIADLKTNGRLDTLRQIIRRGNRRKDGTYKAAKKKRST